MTGPLDALDPGPDGEYPNWPRDESGGTRMSTGLHVQRDLHGRIWTVDLTPTDADGTAIEPPTAKTYVTVHGPYGGREPRSAPFRSRLERRAKPHTNPRLRRPPTTTPSRTRWLGVEHDPTTVRWPGEVPHVRGAGGLWGILLPPSPRPKSRPGAAGCGKPPEI